MIWVMLEHGATVAIAEKQLYNYRDHASDRLTLRPAEQAMVVLERILDKHGVVEPERAAILRRIQNGMVGRFASSSTRFGWTRRSRH